MIKQKKFLTKKIFTIFTFSIFVSSCTVENGPINRNETKSSIKSTYCKTNNYDYYYKPKKWLSYEKKIVKKSCARIFSSEFDVNNYRISGDKISCTYNPYVYYKEPQLWLKWESGNYLISCSRYNPEYNKFLKIRNLTKVR